MMTLSEASEAVGRAVLYARHNEPWPPTWPTAVPERGIISSVNSRYVFVQYGAELHAKATDPADLTLET
jgi:hypothetical protein